MEYKQFENKVKSMSAYDIIMAMVEGLRNPRTRIDMSTFGSIRNGICYGCAATNAILHIMNANGEEVKSHVTYTSTCDDSPLYEFECAINDLRCGLLGSCNANACTFPVLNYWNILKTGVKSQTLKLSRKPKRICRTNDG